MADFSRYSSETRISGRVAIGSGSALLGRVRFFDESYTEGSILCVRGDELIDRETLLLCPPLAVIVFCDESALSLGEICSLGVPCVVFNNSDVRYEVCKNKVALIDTERGILTLDPSIDTLEFYSSAQRKKENLGLNCSVGRALRSVDGEKCSIIPAEHYLVSADLLSEDTFESAVSLWERLCPEALFIEIAVPHGTDSDDRAFSLLSEELFRAALYGNFAISLSGFDCESELSLALRLLHKSFCILEAEGREFNGYLPRGITVSSPIWLMRPSPVTNPDFLILDLDRLLPSLFALSVEDVIKKEKALKKELFSVLDYYFSSFAPRCDAYIKATSFENTSLLRDLTRLVKVKAVFV